MIYFYLCAVLVLAGCKATGGGSNVVQVDRGRKQAAILDKSLLDPVNAHTIAEAERDLPSDSWKEQPFPHNDSKEKRELAVASAILLKLRPELAQMDAVSLVKSLKVFPNLGSMTNNFTGVAYYIYRDGNHMIIEELKSRPRSQLQALASLADEKVEVFEGEQGPGDTLAEVIKHRILGQ